MTIDKRRGNLMMAFSNAICRLLFLVVLPRQAMFSTNLLLSLVYFPIQKVMWVDFQVGMKIGCKLGKKGWF
jgi:hypothetical protein